MLIRNSFLVLATGVPASATALETTTVLDLVAGVVGVDGDGTGQLATAAAVLRQPTPYAARNPAPNPHKNADLGALALQQRSLVSCPELCPDGSVNYCSGSVQGDTTCGEDCCIGGSACYNFTGCVKKDGSCSGPGACYGATLAIIENSCVGHQSCYYIGKDGSVDALRGSCNGDYACMMAGYFGSLGAFKDSCNGENACENLAFRGTVGPITKSCNRDSACSNILNRGSSSSKSITKTCNNDAHKPCQILYYSAGVYGHLTKFIHGETGEKYKRDSIGTIGECYTECVNDDECNGIKWKEHSAMPCRFFGGVISENKCNGRNVCMSV